MPIMLYIIIGSAVLMVLWFVLSQKKIKTKPSQPSKQEQDSFEQDISRIMKFSSKNIVEDKKSGEYRLPHHLDQKTGMYRGRQVLDPKD